MLHQTESRHPLGQLPTANGPTLGTNDFRSTAQTAQTWEVWEVLAKYRDVAQKNHDEIVQSISSSLCCASVDQSRLPLHGALQVVGPSEKGTNEQPLLRTLQHTDNHAHDISA